MKLFFRNSTFAFSLVLTACSSSDPSNQATGDGGTSNACTPADQDGVIGGSTVLVIAVDDAAFTPLVVKAQNLSNVTLTIKNTGTKPHDFVVACVDTPNDRGCPTQSCFPSNANIPSIAPGAAVTVQITLPAAEGIYEFKSDMTGDTQTGQFVLQ